MSGAPPILPPDFPLTGTVEKIGEVSAELRDKIVKIINDNWGDVGKIKHARDTVWRSAIATAQQSMSNLQGDLDRLNSGKETSIWSGEARVEYVTWRNNFNLRNLTPTYNNMIEIKNKLDEAIGKVNGARIRIVAMVVEIGITVAGMATAENPVSLAAAVIAGLSLVGSFLEFELNLRNEFDNLGSSLQTLRDSRKVGYNDGLEYGAPPKFASDVISNWKAWESTQKPTAGN